jgi:hypothetical protein
MLIDLDTLGEISELDVEDKDALIAGFLQRQQVNAVQQALLTHTSPYYRVATYGTLVRCVRSDT